nr:hypothetical protein Iba_chr14bCG10120 [Ipomoea batatas]
MRRGFTETPPSSLAAPAVFIGGEGKPVGYYRRCLRRRETAYQEGSRSSEEPSPPVSSSLPSTKQGTKRGVLSVRSSPEYAATVAIAERERRTTLAAGGLVADAGKGCKSPTLPPPPFTHHRKTGDDGAVTDAGRSEKRVSPPSLLHDAGNRACRCSTADALMSTGELHLPRTNEEWLSVRSLLVRRHGRPFAERGTKDDARLLEAFVADCGKVCKSPHPTSSTVPRIIGTGDDAPVTGGWPIGTKRGVATSLLPDLPCSNADASNVDRRLHLPLAGRLGRAARPPPTAAIRELASLFRLRDVQARERRRWEARERKTKGNEKQGCTTEKALA